MGAGIRILGLIQRLGLFGQARTVASMASIANSTNRSDDPRLRRLAMFAGLVGGVAGGVAGKIWLEKTLEDKRQYSRYLNLMPNVSDPTPPPQAHKDTKQPGLFVVIGRQSPFYLFEERSIPSSKILHEIIGTEMSNEAPFVIPFDALMHSTGYEITPTFSREPFHVTRPEMTDVNISDMQGMFTLVGCARKQAFHDFAIVQKMPQSLSFYHSALCFMEVPADDPTNSTSIVLTSDEIKKIIEETNKHVCREQLCDLINSNCYSAMIYALVETIKLIDQKTDNNPKNSQDIKAIACLIKQVGEDNYSLGVSNNPVTMDAIIQVLAILEKRNLLDLQDEHRASIAPSP